MSRLALAATAAALIFCAQSASAAVVLDQADVPDAGIAFTNAEAGGNLTSFPLGQSFTVGKAGVLDHIDIGLVSLVKVTVPITVSLLDNAGDPLFSQTLGGAAVPLLRFGQTTWQSLLSFDVSSARIRVTPGEILKWKVAAPGSSPAMSLAYQANNVFFSYAGGSSFGFSSLDGVAGRPIGGEDYAFRTYVETSAAPEPAAWALVLAGFGLGGAALRTRRRAAALT